MKINLTLAGALVLGAATAVHAQEVEVTLVDELDGIKNSYCIDIIGGGPDVDPANGLQAHTCYSYKGDLGHDQIFDTAKFAKQAFYMTRFDLCAEVDSAEAGSKLSLSACDGNERQQLLFLYDGSIRPAAAPDLCLTIGTETFEGGNPIHLKRDMTMEACDLAAAGARQIWRVRSEDD